MNSAAFAAKQARRAQSAVHSFAQGIAFLTRVSATSADGGTDGDEGWTDDEAPQPQQTARRIEPWGLHGRPMAGILSAIVRVMGGAASNLRIGIWTGGHGRQNLNQGETQLYNKVSGCEVFLDENGKNNINSAAGQDVSVNGGTLKVARATDPVTITGGSYTPTSLTLNIKDGAGSTGTIAITVAAGALVVAPVGVLPSSTFTLAGAINADAGAARFKG